MKTGKYRTFTRQALKNKNKSELFDIYIRWFNDEMSPIMWRGLTKAQCLEAILDGKDKVRSNFDDYLIY